MPERSAGVLLYRRRGGSIEVLLVHFGGPYWARKDAGAWGLPKGLIEAGESPEEAARREFLEETGHAAPEALTSLGEVVQSGGKRVHAFAAEGEFDVSALCSITFRMDWPPRSGRLEDFPEADRAEWFSLEDACAKILPSQRPLLLRLSTTLQVSSD